MRFATHTMFRALFLGAAAFAVFAAGPAGFADDAIDKQITDLKALIAAGDEGKSIAKMQEMKDSATDTRVIKLLKDLCWAKNDKIAGDKIACAAIKMIANMKPKDIEFLKWLCGKIDDKDLAKKKDGRPELYKTILESIFPYREDKGAQPTLKAALPKLEKAINSYIPTDADYSVPAIHDYGTVPDKFTVMQLLKWGESLDGKTGKGGGKSPSAETRANEDKAKAAVLATLAEVTAKDAGSDVPSWVKWWKENGDKFVFPDLADPAIAEKAAKAAAGPEVPTGLEFKDEGYGYSVKRPDAPGWTFVKADFNGPRMALGYSKPDDPNYLIARAYFQAFDANLVAGKNAEGLQKWVFDHPIKEQLTCLKPPEVSQVKISGTDWTLVKALGDSIGVKQGWGSMERRFYIVKIDRNLFWVDAFVRLGADQDVKDALWKTCETITLLSPPKK